MSLVKVNARCTFFVLLLHTDTSFLVADWSVGFVSIHYLDRTLLWSSSLSLIFHKDLPQWKVNQLLELLVRAMFLQRVCSVVWSHVENTLEKPNKTSKATKLDYFLFLSKVKDIRAASVNMLWNTMEILVTFRGGISAQDYITYKNKSAL